MIATEQLLTLDDAARLIPPARRGRKTHRSTLLRWILRGVTIPDGTRIRLEAVRLGGRWMTSREALDRFAMAQTPRMDDREPETRRRTPARRQRASERAGEQLANVGI